MVAAAGHQSRVTYLWEDNGYATTPTETDHKTFGADVRFNRADGSNDALRVYDPGNREPSDILPRRFNGSWSVEFVVTNPWWLRAVFDAPATTSTTAAPYTHTFSGDVPDSMQITIGLEKPSHHRVLKGCVVRSMDLSVQLDNTVSVTLDGFYADEEVDTASVGPSQVAFSDEPMTFAQASMTLNSTTVNLVQNVSVSIENNVDPVGEIGTRLAVDYTPKARNTSVSFTKIEEANTDEEQRLYGGATSVQQKIDNQVPITVTLDNGETGSAEQTLEFQMTGAFPESYGMTGIGDPESELQQNINEAIEGVTAVATNDTLTAL